VQDGKITIRVDDIHMIWPNRETIPRLNNRHAGGALKQLGHYALLGWIEMLDDHESHTAIGRHLFQKLVKRPQTAGGSPYSYNGESLVRMRDGTRCVEVCARSSKVGGKPL